MSEPFPPGNPSDAERLIRLLAGRTSLDGSAEAARSSADEFLLGFLAVKRGLLDASALEDALREQEAGRTRGEPLPLGQVLIRRGRITEDDLTELLDEQAGRPGAGFRHPRYAVRGTLGEGATSVVYRAWDRDVKREVAVKVLREAAAMSEVSRERFRREAQAAGGLSHPDVMSVYDVGEAGGRLFIVLELVDGRALSEAMKDPGPREPLARALLEAARGVAAAHAKGIVHRDLKPQNILLPGSGGAKVGDFGLAHLGSATLELTRAGSALGTPLYMAPEQVRGEVKEITPRTDVYALGAILYEILKGTPPHVGETVAEIYGKILEKDPEPPDPRALGLPADAATVALKALHKVPAARYPSALEFAEDLRRALDGEPVLARPEGPLRRFWRRTMRRRAALAVAAPLILAALAATAFLVVRHDRRREAAADASRKAREFARIRPDDPDGQVPLWNDAVLASLGTVYEADSIRERDATVLRRKELADADLARLDARTAELEGREEFGTATELVESSRTRHPSPEWLSEIGRRAAALDGRLAKERERLEAAAREARGHGGENEVARLRARVTQWGMPQVLRDFDRTLSGVPLPVPLEDPALVGYWPLDEGKGDLVSDATGKLRGRITGATWTSGRFGTALRFEGGRANLELANSPELDRLQEGSFTLAAWVKPEATPTGEPYGLIMKQGHHMGLSFDIWGRFSMSHWTQEGGGRYYQADTLAVGAGEFHHVAGVLDRPAGKTRIYVDGVDLGGQDWPRTATSLDYGSNPWRLGCVAPSFEKERYSSKSIVDEIRIYSRALSADEVAFLYRARPAVASTWIPIFDGISTSFMSGGSKPYWTVSDGTLVHAPNTGDPQAGQSREHFRDGEFRFRVSIRDGVSSFNCAVREGACRTSFYKAALAAMGEGEHEVVFTCRGSRMSATLDGKPIEVAVEETLPPSGRLMWNSYGGNFRLLELGTRPLP